MLYQSMTKVFVEQACYTRSGKYRINPSVTLISGALTGLNQQTAESFWKYFTQIFYAKQIFVHKIFFLRKSTQSWGDKTDLSKKKSILRQISRLMYSIKQSSLVKTIPYSTEQYSTWKHPSSSVYSSCTLLVTTDILAEQSGRREKRRLQGFLFGGIRLLNQESANAHTTFI